MLLARKGEQNTTDRDFHLTGGGLRLLFNWCGRPFLGNTRVGMRSYHAISIALFLAASAVAAHGGYVDSFCPQGQMPLPFRASDVAATSDMPWGIPAPLTTLPVVRSQTAEELPAASQHRDLPDAPSSLALALSAFATAGLYRVGRNIGRLHFSNLPEWYHTGGPPQIGYATPLQLNQAALPTCFLGSLAPARTWRHMPPDPGPPHDALFRWLPSTPRPPPAFSLSL